MLVFALPSLRQPESISPEFYFTSASFLAQATEDVEKLLKAYDQELQLRATSTPTSSLGPFLTFKSIYLRLGWSYIHLAVVDLALRKDWFNTIVRLFLDYLKPDTEPFKQVAALFALWAFWGTQPHLLGPKFYLIVDLAMYKYIRLLPETLGPNLDTVFGSSIDKLDLKPAKPPLPSRPFQPALLSALATKPTSHIDPSLFDTQSSQIAPLKTVHPRHSLYQIVANLLNQNAFVIHPSQTALVHPRLPTNKLAPDHVYQSPPTPLCSSRSKSQLAEQIVATEDELARWAHDSPFVANAPELHSIRSNYLAAKAALLNPEPVRKEVLSEAIGMTRKVIQKTGPGLDHLLFSPDQERRRSQAEASGGLEAVLLVDGGEGIAEWADAVEALKANLS